MTGIAAPVFANVSYTYDQNGNLTSDGQNCYTYNDANQLSQVKNCSTNQVIAQYVYDYQGNRIEKKVYSSGSLQKTVYSPDKTYETVKQASSGGTATTGAWITGSSSNWAAVIASFNSAGTTPALVQKNKGNGGGTGSVATSFTSSVTTGHAIVVMTITASASNLDTTSITDNQSNSYTQIGTTQHTSGNAYLRIWYAKNVTGGSVTVTAHQSGSASGCLMELLEYSGLSTTAPADQSVSTTGTSTSPSGGSITPTSNNSLIISAFTDDNSDSVSITGTSGYTVEESDLINSTSTRNGIEDQVQTGGTATANTSYYYVNDELAARKNPDGSKNYYLSDNLGSVSVLTNQSGTVVENSTYYPFGQIRSGGTQSKYLYTGQENDSETNLDYYNSRYYNPGNMHFTQPDSELPNVYDPQQLNRYAYVRNNPMTVTDPTGHCPLCIAAVGLGIIGGAINVGFEYANNPHAAFGTYAASFGEGFVLGAAAPFVGEFTGGAVAASLPEAIGSSATRDIIGKSAGLVTANAGTVVGRNIWERKPLGDNFLSQFTVGLATDGMSAPLGERLYPLQGRIPSLLNPIRYGTNTYRQINQRIFSGTVSTSLDETITNSNMPGIYTQNLGNNNINSGVYDMTKQSNYGLNPYYNFAQ